MKKATRSTRTTSRWRRIPCGRPSRCSGRPSDAALRLRIRGRAGDDRHPRPAARPAPCVPARACRQDHPCRRAVPKLGIAADRSPVAARRRDARRGRRPDRAGPLLPSRAPPLPAVRMEVGAGLSAGEHPLRQRRPAGHRGGHGAMTNPLGDALLTRHQRAGRTFATTADGRAWSYADFVALPGRMANALASRGVRPGDRVLSAVDKSVEALALYGACLRAGAVLAPVNPRLAATDLSALADDLSPTLAVCADGVAARLDNRPVLTLNRDG